MSHPFTARFLAREYPAGTRIQLVTPAKGVYTGYVCEHIKETCSQCKNNQPCQYDVEGGEYIKLGYLDFEAGDKFTIEEALENHLRVADTARNLIDFPFSRPNIVFYLITDSQ